VLLYLKKVDPKALEGKKLPTPQSLQPSQTAMSSGQPAPTPGQPQPTAQPTAQPQVSFTDPLPILTVTVSAFQDPNIALNLTDNQPETRWAAQGPGVWAKLDLGSEKTVSALFLAFFRGNARKTKFALSVSKDGEQWQEVFNGTSSGSADSLEQFSFPPVKARYIRITGFGNTENDFTSIYEALVF
jgi:hypothetical protein